uniref:Uncharacterized protein n=1 Tax=Neospora caninum (strain Liverpool) TaxID=572307 RepID=A0A0F7UI77_NEOCL|nr:TPA: hypothetical protein BN1204_054275 [Neospora caninum Liverpool]
MHTSPKNKLPGPKAVFRLQSGDAYRRIPTLRTTGSATPAGGAAVLVRERGNDSQSAWASCLRVPSSPAQFRFDTRCTQVSPSVATFRPLGGTFPDKRSD